MFGLLSVPSCLSGHCEVNVVLPVEFKNCCLAFIPDVTTKIWMQCYFTFCQSRLVFCYFGSFTPHPLTYEAPSLRSFSKSVFVYLAHRQLGQLWPWGWHHLIPEWVRSRRHLGPRKRTTCQDFCLVVIRAAEQDARNQDDISRWGGR